jgi:hypothetical protein
MASGVAFRSSARPSSELRTRRRERWLFWLAAAVVAVLAGFSKEAAAQTFTPIAPLNSDRWGHFAVLLPSGKVLVVGGHGILGIAPANSTEAYNPVYNTWSLGASTPSRSFCVGALLPNGLVILAGGEDGSSSPMSSAVLYNPSADSWSSAPPMSTARDLATAAMISAGFLVAGGSNNGGSLSSVEVYNPSANNWTIAGSMNFARQRHAGVALDSTHVLVTGGGLYAGQSAIASTEIYDSSTNTWTVVGSLATARADFTATLLPNGTVLVVGGTLFVNGAETYLNSAELFTPGANTWSSAGSLAVARSNHTATLLANGQVLVTGGWSAPTASAELYDPPTNTWSTTGSMANQRADHTATILQNGKVLVAAGQGPFAVSMITDTNTAEVYTQASVAPPLTVPAMPLSALVLVAAGLGLVGMRRLRLASR